MNLVNLTGLRDIVYRELDKHLGADSNPFISSFVYHNITYENPFFNMEPVKKHNTSITEEYLSTKKNKALNLVRDLKSDIDKKLLSVNNINAALSSGLRTYYRAIQKLLHKIVHEEAMSITVRRWKS